MNGTKKWYESSGIWGGTAAMITGILNFNGVDTAGVDGQTFLELALALASQNWLSALTIIAGAIAVRGRKVATKAIE